MLGKHRQQVEDCRRHHIMLHLCLAQLQLSMHMDGQQEQSMAVPVYQACISWLPLVMPC